MKYLLILGMIFIFTGCATTGGLSKTGFSFIGVRTESGGLAYHKGKIEKRGEACAYNIIGFLSLGNSGIAEAKKDGGLSKVFFYDTKIVNVAGFFGSVCTKVYGK